MSGRKEAGCTYPIHWFTRRIAVAWSYGLHIFRTAATVIREYEVLRRIGVDLLWTAETLAPRFCEAVFSAPPGNIMLRGKWQSENYFSGIANTIREVFRLDTVILNDQYLGLVHQIETTLSVCVHVRRGDHLSPRRDKEFTGATYYRSAVERLRSNVTIHTSSFFLTMSPGVSKI